MPLPGGGELALSRYRTQLEQFLAARGHWEAVALEACVVELPGLPVASPRLSPGSAAADARVATASPAPQPSASSSASVGEAGATAVVMRPRTLTMLAPTHCASPDAPCPVRLDSALALGLHVCPGEGLAGSDFDIRLSGRPAAFVVPLSFSPVTGVASMALRTPARSATAFTVEIRVRGVAGGSLLHFKTR